MGKKGKRGRRLPFSHDCLEEGKPLYTYWSCRGEKYFFSKCFLFALPLLVGTGIIKKVVYVRVLLFSSLIPRGDKGESYPDYHVDTIASSFFSFACSLIRTLHLPLRLKVAVYALPASSSMSNTIFI